MPIVVSGFPKENDFTSAFQTLSRDLGWAGRSGVARCMALRDALGASFRTEIIHNVIADLLAIARSCWVSWEWNPETTRISRSGCGR